MRKRASDRGLARAEQRSHHLFEVAEKDIGHWGICAHRRDSVQPIVFDPLIDRASVMGLKL